jgi:hypothetical protein
MHANGAGRGSFASHGGGVRPRWDFLISCENASPFRGELIGGGLACLESTQIVILCEAKLQRSPERFLGEARLSISDPKGERSIGKTKRDV